MDHRGHDISLMMSADLIVPVELTRSNDNVRILGTPSIMHGWDQVLYCNDCKLTLIDGSDIAVGWDIV